MVILGLLADDCQLFYLNDKVVKVLAPGSHGQVARSGFSVLQHFGT